jgi:hypothetical protein
MGASLLRVALRRIPRPSRRFQSQSQSQSPGTNPTTKAAKPVKAAKAAKAEDPIPVAATVAPLSFWQKLGPLTRAAEAYARAQRKRPYVTQVSAAMFIYLCGDISAQRMSGKEYDYKRTLRSLVIGATAAIPNYKW